VLGDVDDRRLLVALEDEINSLVFDRDSGARQPEEVLQELPLLVAAGSRSVQSAVQWREAL
jgi:hypothetical protein